MKDALEDLAKTHAVLCIPPASAQGRVDQARRGERIAESRMLITDVLQDTPYLSVVIKEIEAEMKEREDLESMIVQKRNQNAKGH